MSRTIEEIRKEITAKHEAIQEEYNCMENLTPGMSEEYHKVSVNIERLRDEIDELEKEGVKLF